MAGRMDFSGFFDYPEGSVEQLDDELAFLPHATEEEWAKLLAHTETRRFSAGDAVIREGEQDRALYLLTEGHLEAILPGAGPAGSRVRVLTAPTVVGDVAFIDGKPRSATVLAGSDGEMLRLTFDAFESLAAREPKLARDVLLELARILAVRLRQADEYIARSA